MKTVALIFLAVMLSAGKCMCSERSSAISAGQPSVADLTARTDIKNLMQNKRFIASLNFPNTTRRLYEARDFNFAWFNSLNKQQNLWDAMMTLDCVKQYGLDRARYHSKEVSYSVLESIARDSLKNNRALKARTDILLTDAVVSFMVHLHFGMENPNYTAHDIDDKRFTGLKVDTVLSLALESDLEERILSVQPKSLAYTDLQQYMKITVGLQAGDCYQTSEEEFKLMAINLERLRWYDVSDPIHIAINLPSSSLILIDKTHSARFTVKTGTSSNPTTPLNSRISFFTTASEWAIPAKIFREELLPRIIKSPEYLFINNYSIYNRRGRYITPTISNLRKIQSNPKKYRMCQSEGRSNPLGQILFGLEDQPGFLYGSMDSTPALARYTGRIPQAILIDRPELFLSHLLKVTHAEDRVFSNTLEAMPAYQKYTYTFIEPVPIVIRYQTCEIKDGALVTYPDIYNWDMPLIKRLFKTTTFKTWTD